MQHQKNSVVNLSEVREGGVCRMTADDKISEFIDMDAGIFIVTNRWPEDRVSGGTEIAYKDGTHQDFSWDYNNPKVVYLGEGKLETKIVMQE